MAETGTTQIGVVDEVALVDALALWMPTQRWFQGKGTEPDLRLVGSFEFTPGAAVASGTHLVTALVLDEGGPQGKLYQVPLTVRGERMPGESQPPLAVFDQTSPPAFVYDGAHDLDYATALLSLITTDGLSQTAGASATDGASAPGDASATDGASDRAARATASGRSQTPGHPLLVVSSKVLSGEQSNTSIIMTVTTPDGEPAPGVICKVFRVLHHGNNPDVVLQSALAKAGSDKVPASIGSVVGQWQDSRMPDGRTSGHLAFAQEFLPEVEDAWRVALESARLGESFTTEARALGSATAEVHETLAEVMPTLAPSPELIAGVLASMRRRHAGAVREVPALAAHSEAIDRLFEVAAASPWPRLQRIHGDYHLGQVLAVPDGGWVLVDFEGEPLRPMVERNQPDLALRDIAGMLRSFDYVAGSFAQSHPGDEKLRDDAAHWAHEAREAFLDGYSERSGIELRANRALLDAFEIDKALYEAIYEVRNRPSWVTIPVTAVARLANRRR
ncbi:maltokinase N-terminal cap-like domain-containing protein [Subtercola frigoramans]|uniref:Maltokinase n=1 Tax=Subtercola frigoramans TaxID=120298 RepID=A0ABS2L4H2_9MICO|nr:phosphotransferase [Subtercola frigoramans]MBM7472000.1 putative trehalose synthase [Subtercola frigoramans]